jgi:hypothetical protein
LLAAGAGLLTGFVLRRLTHSCARSPAASVASA